MKVVHVIARKVVIFDNLDIGIVGGRISIVMVIRYSSHIN